MPDSPLDLNALVDAVKSSASDAQSAGKALIAGQSLLKDPANVNPDDPRTIASGITSDQINNFRGSQAQSNALAASLLGTIDSSSKIVSDAHARIQANASNPKVYNAVMSLFDDAYSTPVQRARLDGASADIVTATKRAEAVQNATALQANQIDRKLNASAQTAAVAGQAVQTNVQTMQAAIAAEDAKQMQTQRQIVGLSQAELSTMLKNPNTPIPKGMLEAENTRRTSLRQSIQSMDLSIEKQNVELADKHKADAIHTLDINEINKMLTDNPDGKTFKIGQKGMASREELVQAKLAKQKVALEQTNLNVENTIGAQSVQSASKAAVDTLEILKSAGITLDPSKLGQLNTTQAEMQFAASKGGWKMAGTKAESVLAQVEAMKEEAIKRADKDRQAAIRDRFVDGTVQPGNALNAVPTYLLKTNAFSPTDLFSGVYDPLQAAFQKVATKGIPQMTEFFDAKNNPNVAGMMANAGGQRTVKDPDLLRSMLSEKDTFVRKDGTPIAPQQMFFDKITLPEKMNFVFRSMALAEPNIYGRYFSPQTGTFTEQAKDPTTGETSMKKIMLELAALDMDSLKTGKPSGYFENFMQNWANPQTNKQFVQLFNQKYNTQEHKEFTALLTHNDILRSDNIVQDYMGGKNSVIKELQDRVGAADTVLQELMTARPVQQNTLEQQMVAPEKRPQAQSAGAASMGAERSALDLLNLSLSTRPLNK